MQSLRTAARYCALAGIALGFGLASVASAETADSILANAREARRLATCLPGFVWREAISMDLVCVPPPARDRVAAENRAAGQTRAGAGAYGPDTCKPGFVWRDAFANDHVCVSPPARDMARAENALAAQRRVRR